MMTNSIWENDIKIKDAQNKEIKNNVDILIIGAGIAGLSCAYFLKNKNIAVIDKGKIGSGITAKTTAKVTYLQKDIYSTLSKNFNKKISKCYLESQLDAINLMLEIIKKEKIDCDLEKCDSYIFTNNKSNIKKLEKEKELLDSFGIKSFIENNLPLKNIKTISCLKVNDTYTINPLKYLNGLKDSLKKVSIYQNTLPKNITFKDDKIYVETNTNTFICKDVIICNWYQFFIKPGFIPIKTYIKREYVNAAKVDKTKHFTAINIDNNLLSIRFYKDYVIYGSNAHRLTSKLDYGKNYHKSKHDFKKLFSKEAEYTWMNQDIMTNDSLPLIGKVNDNNHVLIATGFNAWGMTNATIAGKLLSDLVLGKENKYESLFSPREVNLIGVVNSLIGTFHYAKAYIETFVNKSIGINGNIRIVKINGKNYGIYYDENNNRHIINLICPHMKCHLVFNNYEKTWDCPCHGSRFDIDGNVINGPSKEKI